MRTFVFLMAALAYGQSINIPPGSSLTMTPANPLGPYMQQMLTGPGVFSYAPQIQSAFGDSPYLIGLLNQPYQVMALRVINQNNSPGQPVGGISARIAAAETSGTNPIATAVEGDAWCIPSGTASVVFCIGADFQSHAEGSGASSVQNTMGVLVFRPTMGANPPIANFGLYLQDQSGIGSSQNYAIYAAGSAPSYFGGGIQTPTINGISAATLRNLMATVQQLENKLDRITEILNAHHLSTQ